MFNSGTKSFISVATARALQLISYLNKEGVALYNQGKYAEAVLLFKQAVTASKTFLNCPLEEVESSTAVGLFTSLLVFPSQAARTCNLRPNMDESLYTKAFEVVVTFARKGNSGHFVCKEAFLLFSRLSTVLIYNWALAHHALGLVYREDSQSSRRRDCLSTARDLYCLAYSIPQQERNKEIIDAALLPLFVKAILNNLGGCYASMDDTEQSVVCFELLLRSIIVSQQDLKVAGNLGDRHDRLSKDHSIACFFNNTLFLVLKDPGFAPAA
ncbi:tetratricopeptide repeat protein [Nitzschia inconspicua]|uniref:Tetratricopeptide repeat protein n=1 Tax=Nitzschia inconspicua TaxID=303405 RepID=A0A9K3KIM6_9STRA|nr:tetratricopeptide repeat protein [Nitzschia inconspicua]